MKRIILLLSGISFALAGIAQTDSTRKEPKNEGDTIRIGNILIIKDGRNRDDDRDNKDTTVQIQRRKHYKPSNVSTNWWIVDLGISQFNDKTNYANAVASGFLPASPGNKEEWFNLRNGKSINVNIWVFMQRLNMVKHYVNLKYGLGIEMNNYRFTENIRFQKTSSPRVLMDSIDFTKNKLAADYVTLPMMLNFNFTPDRRRGFGFSAGASVGYLYNSRQKTIGGSEGKKKVHDDFGLEKWKLSYIGELQLGPVKLYGSYATKSMFKNGLDFTPYNIGIRLSNW
ncbi:MAG TPA: outer membrane beta-barrel protein [Flavitalea sp.]|nr:outer membrane beta-barrel protein [Flavitalea sp.]